MLVLVLVLVLVLEISLLLETTQQMARKKLHARSPNTQPKRTLRSTHPQRSVTLSSSLS